VALNMRRGGREDPWRCVPGFRQVCLYPMNRLRPTVEFVNSGDCLRGVQIRGRQEPGAGFSRLDISVTGTSVCNRGRHLLTDPEFSPGLPKSTALPIAGAPARWQDTGRPAAPVAQLDRVLRFERSGRRFESVRARHLAACVTHSASHGCPGLVTPSSLSSRRPLARSPLVQSWNRRDVTRDRLLLVPAEIDGETGPVNSNRVI
jgi:hypothetical protein